jgi:hypothetical protein
MAGESYKTEQPIRCQKQNRCFYHNGFIQIGDFCADILQDVTCTLYGYARLLFMAFYSGANT